MKSKEDLWEVSTQEAQISNISQASDLSVYHESANT